MKLPYAEKSGIERIKIVDYLLNHEHPEGWPKARFFEAFGFTAKGWETFAHDDQ